MPFPPNALSQMLQAQLVAFAESRDFVELYQTYAWERDTWADGFPDMLRLELAMTASAKENVVRREDVMRVAEWGRLRNIKRIRFPEVLSLPLTEEGRPAPSLAENPLVPLSILQVSSYGLGPTYLSKILHFCLPSEYGAIDTRIVRVLGRGDQASCQEDWLELRVRDDGYGWYIPKNQSAWPREYGKWINILRFFAHCLADNGVRCPHPRAFVDSGLRREGQWGCADVETALFSHASACVQAAD